MASWQNDPVVSSGSSWQSDPVVKEAPRAPAPPKPAPKVMTREDAIKAEARKFVAANDRRRDERLTSGDRVSNQSLGDLVTGQQGSRGVLGTIEDLGDAAVASTQNFLGVGPRIQAGISAVKDGVPYDEALTFWREVNRANREKSLVGDIGGALVGGGAAVKGAGLAARGLTGVAPQVGNFLSRVVNLQKGQKAANTVRVVGTGAAGGAAQAAGEGEDPVQGAIIGAVAAPLAAGALGAGRSIAGRVRNYIRPSSQNIERAAGEVITENPQVLRQRQQDLSTRAGTNTPLIGALNEGDTQNVTERLLKGSREANDVAKEETTNYVRGFMNRMIDVVDRAGASSARGVNNRVTLPSGTQVGLPLQGTVNDLARFRDEMATNMMDPIRNQPVDLSAFDADELERRLARHAGGRIQGLGPRINEALGDLTPQQLQEFDVRPTDMRQARQLLHQWGLRGPTNITVGEADSLRRVLSGAGHAARRAGNTPDADAYTNAAGEIRRLVPYPEYGDMVDAYAANSRMLEGFETAASGKRLSDISDTTLDANLRTQEGRIGMRIGELHRQREAVGRSPASAVSAARDYAAQGRLTRQANITNPMAAQPGTITENIGPGAAADLASASRVEHDTLQRMYRAGDTNVPVNAADENPLNSPETIAYGLSLLSPHTMALTRSRFIGNIIRNMPSGYSPQVAENLTRMIFSTDPVQTQQALALLERMGVSTPEVGTWLASVSAGTAGGRDPDGNGQPSQDTTVPVVDVNTGKVIGEQTFPGPQSSNEDAGFENLASRVEQHESNGDQGAVSDKGAVGVMQVMPDTAPEAAKLAGVPFDEKRYKTDEDYNRQLGRAYLKEMLRQFDGDELAAVAAYNAGPTAVREAQARGGNWVALLPSETQDYIQRVLG